ncbi:MAG: hypothetical protein EBY40_06550 [Marivivens sp.]|nr:hypothetical protein [Marivivens sp.]NBT50734.1 hypothetical protein [Marivivens sp.]NCW68642.1 hypothetical protein [Marivivens sp.]NDH02773.1 hypothetical protein [Marivivens sp.]
MADDPRAAALMKRYGTLKTQRQHWESHWQEIADYIVPRKADITKKRTAGDKRTELIFDGTAIHAAELMSASLHGMLTNAATPWFSLRYENDDLNGDDEAKEWLEGATDVMYQHLARSNFQEQIHELYSDLVTFGTSVIFVEADDDNGVRFSTRHIAECYVSENEQGRVDTVYRQYKTTARAAVRQFGEDKVTLRISKLNEQDPYAEIELLHVVMPREERNRRKKNAVNKPFASIYIDPDEKMIIGESGYDEFPYCVPRFLKASFEIGYGRSPSMTALPDTKMVNKMSEVVIRAAQLQIHPPLMVPDDGFVLPVRTTPGGLNFYRSGTRDRIEPLNIGANNPLGEQQLEQRRQAIRAAFYVDQLILGQGPQMTATEVIQRTEEKMRLLGPVLGRLQAELLQPMINRVFAILARQKQFAPAPPMLRDGSIDIEYVSPLAKAQRSGDVQGIMQMIEFLMPLMQLDQGIVDYLDMDGLAQHIIKVTGTPAAVVRGEGEVSGIREQRAQQQQAQAEMMATQQMAEAAGNAAPALRAVDETDLGSMLG